MTTFPDTMTVRVRYDAQGHGAPGVLTVTVDAVCPSCGGPRGRDTIGSQIIRHHGGEIAVDRWTNPCGHEDVDDALLREARERSARLLPDLAVPPPPESDDAGPIALILAATQGRQRMHAAEAAALLDEHGYEMAAGLVRAEANVRGGHLSAKGAMSLLRDLGAPVPLSPSLLPDTSVMEPSP
ncbi:hypothetical protein [Streptomyces bacillaris]|uniref:hypothetical protein n=1 Tax=Streptomyces bacillaris TaxID=68179 RepID=UPI003634F895